MKKMYKVMALVLCAVLLVAGSVMGTLAYLQMKTDPITNTMTVGNVSITLDEAKVDAYGVKDGDTRIIAAPGQAGNKYKLIPGHTYVKDPTIHVSDTSEACWLFVQLNNGIKDIINSDTVEGQMTAWTCIDTAKGIWAYNSKAAAGDDITVFSSFKISNEANVASYANATITITAYAVQADGFNSALAAWNATFGASANP